MSLVACLKIVICQSEKPSTELVDRFLFLSETLGNFLERINNLSNIRCWGFSGDCVENEKNIFYWVSTILEVDFFVTEKAFDDTLMFRIMGREKMKC